MIRVIPFLMLSFVFINPAPLFAWNKAGHMVTGAIAYQVLQQNGDDKTIARAVALLKKHPELAKWDKLMQKRPPEERDLFLFMEAARWPDDARDSPQFYPPDAHFDKLHYINLPYKPDGQPATVKTAAPEDLNIFRGYADKLAILKGDGAAAERAVALCWVAHLIGDVHQPLHTTSLFTTPFQKEGGKLVGDRGGTRFYIRAKEGKFPISLHKYWDDLLLTSPSFQNVRNLATDLRNRPDFAPKKLTELKTTDFQQWAIKESVAIARDSVYRNGKIVGSPQQNLAKPLPEDYATTVQPIAERRAVLAGYRVAAVLRKAVE